MAVPGMLTASGDCFLLKVRGESMIDAGILDGDYVVVRRQDDAAMARSWPRSSMARRRPSSGCAASAGASGSIRRTTLEPFFPDQVDVLGKIVGVFRRM